MHRLHLSLLLFSTTITSFADESQPQIPFKPSMGGMSDYAIKLLTGLIIIFLIAFVMLAIKKKFNKLAGLSAFKRFERELKILESTSLGNQATVYLVAYQKVKFIIACTTSGQVALIDKITEEQV